MTERQLERITQATLRKRTRLKGKDKIAMRVERALGRFKMRKHFTIEIDEDGFRYTRNDDNITAEAALDGIYIVRTNVPCEQLDTEQTVAAYKSLSQVERAFRCLKTVDLKVRPIYHRSADRVRAHILLCVLAYYVEWHMRQALAPLLFHDDDPLGAATARASIVKTAQRSKKAKRKADNKRTDDMLPVHSFRTLLDDLATLARTTVQPKLAGAQPFQQLTRPTPIQQRAFELLGVTMTCSQ